ncbi:recombinase family protein [Desulfosporosinus burensis]
MQARSSYAPQPVIEIKDVALYLRKSRGEEEDLEKHRTDLEDLCKIKGWRYTEYSEIGTSDSIDLRPKMIQLLKDIENDLFDAVVVMDMDRLSRGDGEEQARIKNVLRRSGTFIVTPNKVYDLNDDGDDMYSDFEGLMARVEYKQIKKRLKRGKKQGARRGDWTNGTPPYPYEYQEWFDEKNKEMYRNEKGLVVNKEKYEIYRYILEKVIVENVPADHVAWELNRQGKPSPRNGRWHGNTIQRILLDETHLGKVISNKSAGDGHKVKRSKDSKDVVYFPRSEWVIVDNCHEAVKTVKEHERVQMFFSRVIPTTPRKQGSRIYPLSGLLKCAKCGHTMVVRYRADRKQIGQILPCWYRDQYGNKCGNSGGKTDIVRTVILEQLAVYEEELRQSTSGDITDNKSLLREIDMTLTEISKLERKLVKIDDLVEEEYYTPAEARQRKADLKVSLDQAETKLNLLQIKLNNSKEMTDMERLNIIDKFKEQMAKGNLTDTELNELYKSIISHIVWDRKDDTYVIEVNFL